MRKFVGARVLVAAGLGLAGCDSGSPIAVLDRERTAENELATDPEDVDGESARFAVE
jgi:hypothetical protein